MTIRVAVIGTRGIPGIHGGVEYHCEELYPRLVARGYEVTIFGREPYVTRAGTHQGVTVQPLPAVRKKSLEAITHSLRAAWVAGREGYDIVHFHSVGPAATIPVARMLGAPNIVFTMHGPDYQQRKWGAAAKRFLRFGEAVGARRADSVISVSRHLQQHLEDTYGRIVHYIPNAPRAVRRRAAGGLLDSLGLKGRDYVLYVGRLVPDKRVEDLIAAMAEVRPSMKVVIAGHSSHAWEYAAALKEASTDQVIFPGWVDTEGIQELYSNAFAFVLPSAVEGLPLSLLEAMGYGVPSIASDIPANREALGDPPAGLIYPAGDVVGLGEELRRLFSDSELARDLSSAGAVRVHQDFDWDRIADQVANVYAGLLGRSPVRTTERRPVRLELAPIPIRIDQMAERDRSDER